MATAPNTVVPEQDAEEIVRELERKAALSIPPTTAQPAEMVETPAGDVRAGEVPAITAQVTLTDNAAAPTPALDNQATQLAMISDTVAQLNDQLGATQDRALADVNKVNSIAARNIAATEAEFSATSEIALIVDTAESEAQQATLDFYTSAGGKAELLEQGGRMFFAGERADELTAEAQQIREREPTGVGLIDYIFNEFAAGAVEEDRDRFKEDEVRAANRIATITQSTQQVQAANISTAQTKTAASVAANQRKLTAMSVRAQTEAELNAITYNADAYQRVDDATGKLLDAQITEVQLGFQIRDSILREQESTIRLAVLEAEQGMLPDRLALLSEQVKQATIQTKIAENTVDEEIEQVQTRLKAAKAAVAKATGTDVEKAELEVKAAELQLEKLQKTHESSIASINAQNEKTVADIMKENLSEDTIAAQIARGQAKMGTTVEPANVVIDKLNSPTTAEVYTKYMMAGIDTDPESPVAKDAASARAFISEVQAIGGAPISGKPKQASDAIDAAYAEQLTVLGAMAPKTEEEGRALYNITAKQVMEDYAKEIKGPENPYSAPPMATVAESKAVQNTVLWKDMVSKMGLQETDPKAILNAAVDLVRLQRVSPEQAATEYNTFFTAAANQNNKNNAGFKRFNIREQDSYNIRLQKPDTSFGSLVAGAAVLGDVGLSQLGYAFDPTKGAIGTLIPVDTDIPILKTVQSVFSDFYQFNAMDYNQTLHVITRNASLLGPREPVPAANQVAAE